MPTPEFILALRKKIGHDLLHVPTVAVVAPALAIKDHSRMFLAAEAHAANGAHLALRTWRPGAD